MHYKDKSSSYGKKSTRDNEEEFPNNGIFSSGKAKLYFLFRLVESHGGGSSATTRRVLSVCAFL